MIMCFLKTLFCLPKHICANQSQVFFGDIGNLFLTITKYFCCLNLTANPFLPLTRSASRHNANRVILVTLGAMYLTGWVVNHCSDFLWLPPFLFPSFPCLPSFFVLNFFPSVRPFVLPTCLQSLRHLSSSNTKYFS